MNLEETRQEIVRLLATLKGKTLNFQTLFLPTYDDPATDGNEAKELALGKAQDVQNAYCELGVPLAIPYYWTYSPEGLPGAAHLAHAINLIESHNCGLTVAFDALGRRITDWTQWTTLHTQHLNLTRRMMQRLVGEDVRHFYINFEPGPLKNRSMIGVATDYLHALLGIIRSYYTNDPPLLHVYNSGSCLGGYPFKQLPKDIQWGDTVGLSGYFDTPEFLETNKKWTRGLSIYACTDAPWSNGGSFV